jgi:hypothetical protein
MVAQGTRRGRNDGNRRSNERESTLGQMGHMATHPQEAISEYPFSSALLVFGVGLGVGLVLSSAICESAEQAWQPQSMSERWGRQMKDYVSQMVPESVSRRFA